MESYITLKLVCLLFLFTWEYNGSFRNSVIDAIAIVIFSTRIVEFKPSSIVVSLQRIKVSVGSQHWTFCSIQHYHHISQSIPTKKVTSISMCVHIYTYGVSIDSLKLQKSTNIESNWEDNQASDWKISSTMWGSEMRMAYRHVSLNSNR